MTGFYCESRVITQCVAVISCRLFRTTYRSHLQGSKTQGSRNVGKKLPLFAAYLPRRAQFSAT